MEDINWDEPIDVGDNWNKSPYTDYKLLINGEIVHADSATNYTSTLILREVFNSYLNDIEYKSVSADDIDKRFKLGIEENWKVRSKINITVNGNIDGNQIQELIDFDAHDERENNNRLILWEADHIEVMTETDIESGVLLAEITNLNQNILDLYPNTEIKIKLPLSKNEIISVLDELMPWEFIIYLYLEKDTEKLL